MGYFDQKSGSSSGQSLWDWTNFAAGAVVGVVAGVVTRMIRFTTGARGAKTSAPAKK